MNAERFSLTSHGRGESEYRPSLWGMPLLERSKLYKDFWSLACTKIAAELGISGSALKRFTVSSLQECHP